jgi:hypothetical protein
MRTQIFDAILEELACGELKERERVIFHALRRVYPAGLTRAQLIQETAGYTPLPEENLNNNRYDRKNRIAIASMFSKGIPIVSTSGEAGYRLDVNEKHFEEMLVELMSRRENLSEKIERARQTLELIRKAKVAAIPTDVPETPVQLTFLPPSPIASGMLRDLPSNRGRKLKLEVET